MNLFKKIAFVSFFSLIFGSFLINDTPSFLHSSQYSFIPSALAEDEDDEDDEDKDDEDDEDDEDKDRDDSPKITTETQQTVQNITVYKPVTRTVIVTDEAFQKDTDGDELVDAIDPDPLRHQSEYFTDTDGDGVPNALDQHHDEDDFAYYEFETDEDENGIIDSYEQ